MSIRLIITDTNSDQIHDAVYPTVDAAIEAARRAVGTARRPNYNSLRRNFVARSKGVEFWMGYEG